MSVRLLRDCEVTHHALSRYLERCPGASTADGPKEIKRRAVGAVFSHRQPTGEEVYRGNGLRFVLWPVARRRPVLLTVLPGEQPEPRQGGTQMTIPPVDGNMPRVITQEHINEIKAGKRRIIRRRQAKAARKARREQWKRWKQ